MRNLSTISSFDLHESCYLTSKLKNIMGPVSAPPPSKVLKSCKDVGRHTYRQPYWQTQLQKQLYSFNNNNNIIKASIVQVILIHLPLEIFWSLTVSWRADDLSCRLLIFARYSVTQSNRNSLCGDVVLDIQTTLFMCGMLFCAVNQSQPTQTVIG